MCTRHSVRRLCLALTSGLLCWFVAACAASSVKLAIPTATPFALLPTATPDRITEQLTIPSTGNLVPSPDGSLIAAGYGSTMKLFTVADQEQGAPYTLPTGIIAASNTMSWLPDSSGVFISVNFISDYEGPLLIMNRQGQVRSAGLNIGFPHLSQDGQWIGGTTPGNDLTRAAEIAPRSGGPARVLAQGGTFLGWQNNRAIYTTGGYGSSLYALDPSNTSSTFIAQLGDNETPEPPYGDVSSPDGQVLILGLGKMTFRLLVGNQLQRLPPTALLQGNPVLWAGQHNIVAVKPIQDDLVVEDIVTGTVMSDSGATNLNAMAISGSWIVGAGGPVGQSWELSLVNIQSHKRYDVGTAAAPVFPLGNQGRFLVTPSSGAAYIIDSARINGSSN